MVLFQIIFVALSFIGIFTILNRRRVGRLNLRSTLFWLLFLVAADVVVLKPEITTIVANKFGIGRGADFVLYLAIILVFYLLFKLNLKVETLNRDLTKIVRERALEDIEED